MPRPILHENPRQNPRKSKQQKSLTHFCRVLFLPLCFGLWPSIRTTQTLKWGMTGHQNFKDRQFTDLVAPVLLRISWPALAVSWRGPLHPGFRDLQPYGTQKLRIASESAFGVFLDLLQMWFRKCQTVLGATSNTRYRPKGVFGKGVGNSKKASEMRQKFVKNASK